MTRFNRTRLCLFALLLPTMAGPAFAADPPTINTPPGQSVVVADHLKGKPPTASATSGTVRIATDAAHPDSGHVVVYTPPPGAVDLLDTVKYTPDGGSETTVPVQVRNPDSTLSDTKTYSESFKALFELFIIAILVESGLALLFRWKPFLSVFDPAAMNAVVAFLFSFTFVWIFDLDIVSRLFSVYTHSEQKPEFAGQVLTAMIIAGGSSVVNKLFQAFGLRSPLSHDDAAATTTTAQPTTGWIAVTPNRVNAVGEITVLLSGAAVGTIEGGAGKRSLLSVMLRDRGRFPPSDGFPVAPGNYSVSLAGRDSHGAAIVSPSSWGPYPVIAGAILDIELTI
ncbi:MAG TPA: hypothetical protein VII56_17250 [Rhizomicrobium sp.]